MEKNPLGELEITAEGLLEAELQQEIEARIAATVENLFVLDVELETFVKLVKKNVKENKDNPDNLQIIYDYLDEMWGAVIANELRDVLLDTICIVQDCKHELQDVLEELEEILEK